MSRSPLRIILFVAFVDLISFGLIIPLQAAYAKRLDASPLMFGCLVGVYALMQIIFNPILGRWSDRVGRRPVLMLSIAGSVASHALLGAADLAQSLPWLFVARTLDGVTGANIATVQAYIADVTTEENRAKSMGFFGAAFGAGFVLGPTIAVVLLMIGTGVSGSEQATAWPAFGAAVISLTALFLVWRYLPEPEQHAQRASGTLKIFTPRGWRELARTTKLKELFTCVFGTTFAFVMLEVTLVYLCMERFHIKERGVGLIFTYFGILMVIVQGGLIGRLVKRHGEAKLLAIAPWMTGVGLLMIGAVSLTGELSVTVAWVLLLVGCVPTAVGQGLTGPNLNSLISKSAAVGDQGATFGASQGVGSLARAIAPPVGGALYAAHPFSPYVLACVLLAGVGFVVLAMNRSQKQVETPV